MLILYIYVNRFTQVVFASEVEEENIQWYDDIGNDPPKVATFLPWLFGQPNGGKSQ